MAERNDFPVNSKKAKEGLKKEPVVKEKREGRELSTMDRVGRSIVAESACDIKEYVIFQVLVPAAKETVSTVIKSIVDLLFYGSTGKKDVKDGGYKPYSSLYDRDRAQTRDLGYGYSQNRRNRYPGWKLRGYPLTEEEADEILDIMTDILRQGNAVTVADVYELCNIESTWADNGYGWTRIGTADKIRTRNGWELDLPRPKPLD